MLNTESADVTDKSGPGAIAERNFIVSILTRAWLDSQSGSMSPTEKRFFLTGASLKEHGAA
jgi:hypothetical protein